MRNYLADKTAYFVFDSQKSRDFDIKAGVPQESPLSPVLFLLYIATLYEDLQAAYQQLIIIGFANDINLLTIGSTFENTKNLLEAAWGTCEKCYKKPVWNSPSKKANYYTLATHTLIANCSYASGP
jgi:hypothetical protein